MIELLIIKQKKETRSKDKQIYCQTERQPDKQNERKKEGTKRMKENTKERKKRQRHEKKSNKKDTQKRHKGDINTPTNRSDALPPFEKVRTFSDLLFTPKT